MLAFSEAPPVPRTRKYSISYASPPPSVVAFTQSSLSNSPSPSASQSPTSSPVNSRASLPSSTSPAPSTKPRSQSLDIPSPTYPLFADGPSRSVSTKSNTIDASTGLKLQEAQPPSPSPSPSTPPLGKQRPPSPPKPPSENAAPSPHTSRAFASVHAEIKNRADAGILLPSTVSCRIVFF